MQTIPELTRKNNETQQKMKSEFHAKVERIKESDLKRIRKVLEKTKYYENEFTDKEWKAAIDSMIAKKTQKAVTNAPTTQA